MITKEQWDMMSDQSRWDLFQVMQDEIAALDESADDENAERRAITINLTFSQAYLAQLEQKFMKQLHDALFWNSKR